MEAAKIPLSQNYQQYFRRKNKTNPTKNKDPHPPIFKTHSLANTSHKKRKPSPAADTPDSFLHLFMPETHVYSRVPQFC